MNQGIRSSIEPLTVGRILDRGLKLLLPLFVIALPWYIFLCLMATASNYFGTQSNSVGGVALSGILGLVNGALGLYVYLLMTVLAAEHWNSNAITLREADKRVSFTLFWSMIGLTIVVTIGTFLWAILLLIPGLVYMTNRLLSYYILVIERKGVFEAIRKSKYLMTRGRFFSLKGPVMRLGGMLLVLLFASGFYFVAIFSVEGLYAENRLADYLYHTLFFFSTLLAQLTGLFSLICFVGFYFDLTARYEGADLTASLEEIALEGSIA